MIKYWWKILGAGLVLYALVAGLCIPLKSGVETVSPSNTTSGESLSLTISAYNADYQGAEVLRAWLKLDSVHYVPAQNIKVLSAQRMEAAFDIPHPLPNNEKTAEMTLIIDNDKDGYALLPGAVSLRDTMQKDTVIGTWVSSIRGIHEAKGYTFPYRNILYETIRNLFYHVPLWFGMMFIFLVSAIYSMMFLGTGNSRYDHRALSLNQVGILYGILGLLTGAIWANWTWGEPWSGDVKQNMSAIAMLVYLAYLVLRYAFDDYERQARVSSAYNIFAFATLIPLLFVIPRLYDSLHPGNGGNPGFGGDDLDNTMRMVFYPAVIGFTLIGLWVADLVYRFLELNKKWQEDFWED